MSDLPARLLEKTSAAAPSTLKGDLYRRDAALRFTMIDGLDVFAVGVEQEGGKIAGVVGPLTRSAIVPAAGSQSCLLEGFHHGAVRRLKG